ncbi:C-type lectin mannose-binding isoform [Amia ocellicauda]|uniref:C-type lectin mannose-binding isoform n=1 Tax=Amia ocellicauda TaxID=2972642 RepID=UPI00346442E9
MAVKSVLVVLVFCLGAGTALDMSKYCSVNFPRPCPLKNYENWYSIGSLCAKYEGTPLNYSEAEFACRKSVLGGHLVSVHNNEANVNVLCLVTKYNQTSQRVWLGAFELFRTTKFVWTDGSDWNYSNWLPGQPDNTANVEDCVEMNWKNTGKWNDDRCSAQKSYVCAFKNRARESKQERDYERE